MVWRMGQNPPRPGRAWTPCFPVARNFDVGETAPRGGRRHRPALTPGGGADGEQSASRMPDRKPHAGLQAACRKNRAERAGPAVRAARRVGPAEGCLARVVGVGGAATTRLVKTR